MPKRVAEEVITKEHGSTPNAPGQDATANMSTAAQLAKRKIATPKGRLGNRAGQSSGQSSGQPSGFGSGAPNPFGQVNQQQTFAGMNGGFTFGSSQSFPPGPAPSGNGFNFQPPQSNSFTFGAPNPAPNPFASLNGTGGGEEEDVSMESPRKKPAFGNTFGASNNESNAHAGLNFGQQPQQPVNGGFGFGAVPNTNGSAGTNGAGLFGQGAQPEAPAPAANPFGPAAQPQGGFGGFGQPTPAPQAATPAFGFGQQAQPVANSSNPFGFGQGAPAAQPSAPVFGLGQPATSQPPKEPAKFVFGQVAAAPPSAGAFGSSNGSTPFSFSQPQAPPPSGAPFGNLNATQGSEPKAATPLFAAAAAAGSQLVSGVDAQSSLGKSPAANHFAGLLAGGAGATAAALSPKPIFSFGQTTEVATAGPVDTSSGPPSSSTMAQAPESAVTQQPALTFGSQSQTAPTAPQTSTFFSFGTKPASPKDTTANESSDKDAEMEKRSDEQPQPAKASSAPKPAFSFTAPTPPASGTGFFSPSKVDTNASIGKASFTPSETAKAGSGTQSGSILNDGSQPAPASNPFSPKIGLGAAPAEKTAAQPPSAKPSLGELPRSDEPAKNAPAMSKTPTADAPSQQRSLLFEANSRPHSQPSAKDATAPRDASAATAATSRLSPAKALVYTKGPLAPTHLDAEQYREYDRNYRLHCLNLALQKRLSKMDPRTLDFENVIRHYVAGRESIGASLGLYLRSVAGTKRKGDRVDDRADEPHPSKRTRPDDTPASGSSQSSGTASSVGGFTITPASAQKPTPAPAVSAATPLKATKMLQGMVPEKQGDSASKIAGKSLFTNAQSETGFKPASSSVPRSTAASTPAAVQTPPERPAFEVPKFGSGNMNFMSAFGQQAQANAAKFEKSLIEKRKAEEFDSDEDDEETFQKQAEEDMRAKRAKIASIASAGFTPTVPTGGQSSSAAPTFKFGTATGSSKESTPFVKAPSAATPTSNPFAALTSPAGSASPSQTGDDDEDTSNSGPGNDRVEHDSDDHSEEDDEHDDQDETNEEDEPGFDPLFDNAGEDDEEDDSDSENDLQAALDRTRKNPNAGKSLFDRIERIPDNKDASGTVNGDKHSDADSSPIRQPAKNSTFPATAWGSHIGKSTPPTPSFSPITPATAGLSKSTYKPSTTFNFTPTPSSTNAAPVLGASIFAGGLTKGGPVPGEGMFGSRPSTPSNVEKAGTLTKSLFTSPPGTDNTWKQGAPISFGNSEKPQTPTFKLTAASPGETDSASSKSLGTLFGTPTTTTKGSEASNQLGFQFGAPTSAPAPGFLGAVSHLGGGSGVSSGVSSRATSPGLTDNESLATNETDEAADDPQASLMESRIGEENETCVWEGRSKALIYVTQELASSMKQLKPNEYNSMGVGQLRVLKDKTTGKTRALFRLDPSAAILINSHLLDSFTYENVSAKTSGAVRGPLFYKGNLTRWVLKVKTPEMAAELATVLEDNKKA